MTLCTESPDYADFIKGFVSSISGPLHKASDGRRYKQKVVQGLGPAVCPAMMDWLNKIAPKERHLYRLEWRFYPEWVKHEGRPEQQYCRVAFVRATEEGK